MGGLLVCGATSDAGKSVVVAGLCRLLARRGVRVAPFKAQNMSLNSAVAADGAEIGRAQALQAAACGIEAEAVMNPILLKPLGDRRSQVVVLGKAVGVVDAGAYRPGELWDVVLSSLDDLRRRFDVVVCEGAGGAAEINLLDRDVANLPLAARAGMPAVVVGDIERGGVFASLYGTHALVPDELRRCIRGFLVNRFRGDADLLGDGPAELERRTGVPVLGVLPWVPGITIDAEDSLALDRAGGGEGPVDVAVVRLPHTSNFTDLDPLALEPSVTVRWVTHPAQLGRPHLVVLPGSRSTVADLAWLRERGFDRALAAPGAALLGICGGYQMLGRTILDDVESGAGCVEGLGLLDAATRFEADKVVERWGRTGYRIHHGRVTASGEPWLDGARDGRRFGTSVHGLLEDDAFREAFLAEVGGAEYVPARASFEAARQTQLDRLADLLDDHADVDRILALV
jgi:adenosylcobyric acid synthase